MQEAPSRGSLLYQKSKSGFGKSSKGVVTTKKVKEKHHKYLPVATGKHAHKYEETCP